MKQINPESVQEFLRKRGVEVTIEQAIKIYDFMLMIARISVTKFLEQ